MAIFCALPNDPIYKKVEEAVGSIAAHSLLNKHNGDLEFIKNYSKDEIINLTKQISHEKSHTTPLNHLKVFLKKKYDKINNAKTNNKDFKLKQLKKQEEKLKDVDEVIGIAQVIDYLYDEAIGEKVKRTNKAGVEEKVYSGYVTKLDDYISELHKETAVLDSLEGKAKREKLNKIAGMLQAYYDYAESLDHISEYKHLYVSSVASGVKPVKGSTLWKIEKLLDTSDNIKTEYKKHVLPITAKILYSYHSKEANAGVQKEFDQEMIKLKALQDKGKDVDARIKEAISRYEVGFVTESSILKNLQEISSDVPYMDKMLTPMISVGDYTLSLFAKFVKKDFFDARLELASWKQDAAKEYNKFIAASKFNKDAVHKLNAEITEVIVDHIYNKETNEWEERRHNALVQEIDINSYNNALAQARKEANNYDKTDKAQDKLRKQVWAKFFKENTEKLSYEDRVEYGRTIKGVKSLVKEQRDKLKAGTISEEDFDHWVASVFHNDSIKNKHSTYGVKGELIVNMAQYSKDLMDLYADGDGYKKMTFRGEFVVPKRDKFLNPKYMAMSPAAREYHGYMVQEYFKSQEAYPDHKQNGYILPYMYKTKRELLSEGRVKDAGNTALQESFTIRKDDTEYGQGEGNVNPIYYTNYIPAEDSTLDVFESIVEFKKMSRMYEAVSEIEPTANAFKVLIKDRKTLDHDGKGNILTRVGKVLGIDNYKEKDGPSNAAEMVDWFVEQQLYHQFNLKELINTPWGQVDAGKTISTVMGAASLSMLGGPELLKSMANSIQAKLQRSIESASEEFFNKKDMLYGEKEFAKHSKDIFGDFVQPISTTLTGQWLDMVDFIQGNFMDEFGNNISGSAMKKLATSGTWMFANNFSEFQTQASSAFSLANTIKLLGPNGEQYNVQTAYELGSDGKIKLKDGVTKEDGTPFTNDDLFDFMNRLHALNKRLDGVYNGFDRSLAKRWSIWRLLLMFKGFLPPTLKKRFKSYGTDQELGAPTEGYYVTFYKAMLKDRGDLVKFLMKKENNLTDLQKNNVRRAIHELSLIIGLTIAVIFMAGLGDDDEELKKNWAYQFALYQLTRSSSELRFYLPVLGAKDQLRLFTSPSAMNGFAERVYKAGAQTFGYTSDDGWAFNDTYKVKSGNNEKGDSKLAARYAKLLGFNGNNLTPSQATEVFEKL